MMESCWEFTQPLWKRLLSWSNIFNQKMVSPFARNRNLAGWVPAVAFLETFRWSQVLHLTSLASWNALATRQSVACHTLAELKLSHWQNTWELSVLELCLSCCSAPSWALSLAEYETAGFAMQKSECKSWPKISMDRNAASYHVTFANRNGQMIFRPTLLVGSSGFHPQQSNLHIIDPWMDLGSATNTSQFQKKILNWS